MYTNIPTDATLEEMQYLPCRLLAALAIIMKNNIFQFSDTYWKQLSGTATGTLPACMWATLFFQSHEKYINALFGEYLLDWAWYIDDGIGIWNWTGTPECIRKWKHFKACLQEFHL